MPYRFEPLLRARAWGGRRLSAFGKATVAAALSGDRRAAIDALALNPLIPNRDVAETIGGELLAAHAAHLPRFAR